MGHRLSKADVAINNKDTVVSITTVPQVIIKATKGHESTIDQEIGNKRTQHTNATSPSTSTPNVPILKTLVEEIKDNPGGVPTSHIDAVTTAYGSDSSGSNIAHIGSFNSINNTRRQIIIKIQLAKMENEMTIPAVLEKNQKLSVMTDAINASGLSANSYEFQQSQHRKQDVMTAESFIKYNNLNKSSDATSSLATSLSLNKNKDDADLSTNALTEQINKLQLMNDQSLSKKSESEILSPENKEDNSIESVEYSEVLEETKASTLTPRREQQQQSVFEMFLKRAHHSSTPNASTNNASNSCCQQSKLKSGMGASLSSSGASKRRCCKCKCRDAIRGLRGILETSATKNCNKDVASPKELQRKKEHVGEHRHSVAALSQTGYLNHSSTNRTVHKRNSIAGTSRCGEVASSPAALNQNHVSIWTPNANNVVGDVIIHISTPQFLTVENGNGRGADVSSTSLVTVGRMDIAQNTTATTAIHLVAAGDFIENNITPMIAAIPQNLQQEQNQEQIRSTQICNNVNGVPGPIVHSQIDFVHFLVPDLERITNSSFYWGKMDRYEAERLLESKPEGTFLLRDSAQEEYLFSVTFRKYGRSLHARIEQSGHKFSFDCHDPCVFTACTVTGLLEHYKDPSCVMFFEPMLTIPLHRKTTFSLQQLCRATIVSNTSYDGINQLELPVRLKCYLKEYHYKQKVRVKPIDETFYANT